MCSLFLTLISYCIYSTPLNLSSSTDIVANSISVVSGNRIVDIFQSLTNLTGLPPDTLNTIEKLATAVKDNPNFGDSIMSALAAKQQSLTLIPPLQHIPDPNTPTAYDLLLMQLLTQVKVTHIPKHK